MTSPLPAVPATEELPPLPKAAITHPTGWASMSVGPDGVRVMNDYRGELRYYSEIQMREYARAALIERMQRTAPAATPQAPTAPEDERKAFVTLLADYRQAIIAEDYTGEAEIYRDLISWGARAAAPTGGAPATVEGLRQGNWHHPDGGRIVGWVIPPDDKKRMKADAFCLPGEVADALARLRAGGAPASDARDAASDTALLDWLREETCDLRCIDVPTGAGDADVHWVVIQHHMSAPHEREIGRGYSDDPRDAIRAAMGAKP